LNLELYPLSTESLTLLIDFVIEHDETLILKMNQPIFIEAERYLYLGNNAIEQLGVVSRGRDVSLLKLIDKTSTAFGKRLLKEMLLNPVVIEIL